MDFRAYKRRIRDMSKDAMVEVQKEMVMARITIIVVEEFGYDGFRMYFGDRFEGLLMNWAWQELKEREIRDSSQVSALASGYRLI